MNLFDHLAAIAAILSEGSIDLPLALASPQAMTGHNLSTRRKASNAALMRGAEGLNIYKHPVIDILLRIDEFQDEAGPDDEASGADS